MFGNARERLVLAAKRVLWRAGLEIAAPHNAHTLRVSRSQFPPQFRTIARSPRITPFSVDLEYVTTCIGFSYASDGFHPYVATLKEYAKDSSLRFEDSSLFRYFNAFRPRNAQHALLDSNDPPRAVLHTLPPHAVLHVWTMARKDLPSWTGFDVTQENQHFGPKTLASGRREFARLIEVFESIRDDGYRPGLTREPISGHFLYCGGNYRFVLREGQHRAAALKMLGATRIPVVVWDGVAGINCAYLHRWSSQQGGLFPIDVVNEMFAYLLEANGREKAIRSGIIDQPSAPGRSGDA